MVGGENGVVLGCVAMAEAVENDQNQGFGRCAHNGARSAWVRYKGRQRACARLRRSGVAAPGGDPLKSVRHSILGPGKIPSPLCGLWWTDLAVYTGRHFTAPEPRDACQPHEFATNHFILAGLFVIILALLIFTELSKGGKSLSRREVTALNNRDEGVVVDIRSKKGFRQTRPHRWCPEHSPRQAGPRAWPSWEKHKAKTIIVVDALASRPHCRPRTAEGRFHLPRVWAAASPPWRGDKPARGEVTWPRSYLPSDWCPFCIAPSSC